MSLESDIERLAEVYEGSVSETLRVVGRSLQLVLDNNRPQPEDFPGAELHDRLLAETFDPRP